MSCKVQEQRPTRGDRPGLPPKGTSRSLGTARHSKMEGPSLAHFAGRLRPRAVKPCLHACKATLRLPTHNPHISTKPQDHTTQGHQSQYGLCIGACWSFVTQQPLQVHVCMCTYHHVPIMTLGLYRPLNTPLPPPFPCPRTIRSEPQEARPASVQSESQDGEVYFPRII